MTDILQLVGAFGVLAAFIAVQRGWWRPTSYLALIFNLWGSALLAVLALLDEQWGFLLLEAVWAIVSAAGLLGLLRGGPGRPADAH
jgi:hypothetical protein